MALAAALMAAGGAAPCRAERLIVGSAGGGGESVVEPIFSINEMPPQYIEPRPPVQAEDSGAEDGPPPGNKALTRHVTDQAGLILAVMETRLEEEFELRARQERIPVYLVTVSKPPAPIAEYAAALCQSTLRGSGAPPGGVLVMETAPLRIAAALSARGRLLLPDDKLAELINQAVADQPEDVAPGSLLAFAGRRLADRLKILDQERSEAARVRNTVLLAAGSAAALILLAVLIKGLFAMWISNLFDRRYTFPETETPPRFGGLFSGGHGVVMDFYRRE